jgi:hypothetical protein
MSKEKFESSLRAKAREISNMAADEVIGELADKVMEEKDEDQQGQEVIGDEAGVLPGAVRCRELTDRIREVVVVLEAFKGQTRASPRLQRSRDEHVLVKAKEQAAKKNIEFKDGNSPPPPLFFVSSDLALHYLQQLGLNLGSSDLEQNNNLCSLLDHGKGGEESELGVSDNEWLGWDSEEDSCEEVEKRALRSLCGELMEEIFDESNFPLNSELDGFKRKGKSHAKYETTRISSDGNPTLSTSVVVPGGLPRAIPVSAMPKSIQKDKNSKVECNIYFITLIRVHLFGTCRVQVHRD